MFIHFIQGWALWFPVSFEWTLMNSLGSALKCSKVFYVFCSHYQCSIQKVLCPELFSDMLHHYWKDLNIVVIMFICLFVCFIVTKWTRTTSSTTVIVLSYIASSRFSHKDQSLGIFINKSIHCLSLAWKRMQMTSFLLCHLFHQIHWMKPSHPR